MENATSMTKSTFINVRLIGNDKTKMLYTPAHTKPDGKNVRARLNIPVLANVRGKEKPQNFRLIAWGGLADLFAKALAKGKEMTFETVANPYWANVYNNAGAQITQPDGTALQVMSINFEIKDFIWGKDSKATLDFEIANGLRPADWNIMGSPGNATWKSMLATRKATFYNGGDVFGYAKVIAPRTPGCTILLGDQSKLKSNPGTAVAGSALPAAPGPVVAAVAAALPVAGAVTV